MTRFRLVAALGALLLFGGMAFAQAGAPDIIPSNSPGALVVTNLDQLRKKGDDLVKEVGWTNPLRPSQLFDMVLGELNLIGLLDEGKPMGVVLANSGKNEEPNILDDKMIVFTATLSADLEKVAAQHKVKAEDLKAGKMVTVPKPRPFPSVLHVQGKQLYLATTEEAIRAAKKSAPLAKSMKADRAQRLAKGDVVLYLGAKFMGEFWKDMLREIERELFPKTTDKETAKRILTSLQNVRYGAVSLRVEKGIGFSVMSVFEDNKTVAQFLGDLRKGPGSSNLTGLPEGNVLFAEAAKGKGSESAVLARLLLEFFLREFRPTRNVVADTDRHNVLNVFYQVWKRLEGNRMAVYLNQKEAEQGLVSLVAILDTADAKQFLGNLQLLSKFGDSSTLKLDKTGNPKDIADVKKLVADLGDDDFEVRENASTKLALLGEAALPYLKEALASDDPERVQRARELLGDAENAAAQRRKDLLSGEFKFRLRPSFVYYPKGEKRPGGPVDVIGIKIDQKSDAVIGRLKGIFGPNWDKIRIGVHKNQVVLLVGSNAELFDSALRNLREGKPGLAGAKSFAASSKMLDSKRRIEAHVSVQKMISLLGEFELGLPKVKNPGPEVTSVSASIGEDEIQLDIWFPSGELRPMVKAGGL